MSDTLQKYIELNWQRRAEIRNIIFQRTKGIVYQGPFKGLKILPKWTWGDGDCIGKLLGIYECELYQYIEESINRNPDLILNIGSAEGYYGLGLSKRTNIPTVLFDINPNALNIARETAKENNIHNVQFNTDCNPEEYQRYLEKAQRPFIVMDIEGAEDDILDLKVMPDLVKADIIVECHDCNKEGISLRLIEKFQATHWIKIIPQGAKNPYMEITDDFNDYDKMIMCCEARPRTMTWMYMVPK